MVGVGDNRLESWHEDATVVSAEKSLAQQKHRRVYGVRGTRRRHFNRTVYREAPNAPLLRRSSARTPLGEHAVLRRMESQGRAANGCDGVAGLQCLNAVSLLERGSSTGGQGSNRNRDLWCGCGIPSPFLVFFGGGARVRPRDVVTSRSPGLWQTKGATTPWLIRRFCELCDGRCGRRQAKRMTFVFIAALTSAALPLPTDLRQTAPRMLSVREWGEGRNTAAGALVGQCVGQPLLRHLPRSRARHRVSQPAKLVLE